MNAIIWHNPRCSKSRETLAILHERGVRVTIVDYLRDPPSVGTLSRLYARAGLTPAEGLRTAEPGARRVGQAGDVAILEAMAANPILIERPLVETEKGVRLCRPPSRVEEIM